MKPLLYTYLLISYASSFFSLNFLPFFSKNGDVVYERPTHVNKLVIANGEIIFDKVERDMNHSSKHLHNLQNQTKNRSKN